MKGLKIAAFAALSLLVVLVLLTVYLFMVAEVEVTGITAQGISAASDVSGFDALKGSLDTQTFMGTLYNKPAEWKDAGEYVYITYTVNVRNGCLVPIDMVEVQVVPMADDILQLPEQAVHTVRARSEGSVNAVILTNKSTHPVREIIVTYYVWGVSFSVKSTYGE